MWVNYQQSYCEFRELYMIHRGKIIQKVLKDQDVKVSSIAKKLHKDRTVLYDWFANPDLSLDTIVKIGKVIKYDFGQDIPELRSSTLSEPGQIYNSLPLCQQKLFEVTLELNEKNKEIERLNKLLNLQKG